jgi:hypothetical protein
MYLLNQPIRAVFCEDNGRCRLDIIPAGALVELGGRSTYEGMVEVVWRGVYCSVFLADLESRSLVMLPASA